MFSHRGGVRWDVLAHPGLAIAALAPVLVVVVTRTGRDYLPVQDLAVIDLRVRDVWSLDTPLVGPYSKGFNHPGPMFYWLLAVPSRLFGQAAWATLVGGAIAMGVAIVATARLAFRRGGLVAGLVAVLALSLGLHDTFLFLQPWNPNTVLSFFVLFLVLAWVVATGELRHLVWLAVVGSLLVQSHVGYLLLVAGPTLTAVALGVRAAHGADESGVKTRREVTKALGVLVVLWSFPLLNELFGERGNVSAMVYYARETAGSAVGIHSGLGLMATDFKWLPTWLGGNEPALAPLLTPKVVPSSGYWLVTPVVLLLVASWLAWFRPHSEARVRRAEQAAIAIAATAIACGVVALAQVRPPIEEYLFRWRSPLAVLVLSVCIVAITSRLPRRTGVGRFAVAMCAATVLTHSVFVAVTVAREPVGTVMHAEPSTRAVFAQISGDEIPDAPFLVRTAGDPVQGVFEAIVNELDRRGRPVRLDESARFKWGDRTVAVDEVDVIWYVTTSGSLGANLRRVPSARVIATLTPLPADLEEELSALQLRIGDELAKLDTPGARHVLEFLDSPLVDLLAGAEDVDIDPVALRRIAELNEIVWRSPSCRCSIIAVDSDEPADEWVVTQ